MIKAFGHNKNKDVLTRARAQIEYIDIELACTVAENQLVPMCTSKAKDTLGDWKSVHIRNDHIALQAGFSKVPFQGQCVTMDGVRYIHVKKNSPWFIAAVGGPQLKKGGLPSVQVIDQLCSKVFGNNYTDVEAEDQDRSRGEDDEPDEGVEPADADADHDPMNQLEECAATEFETPKKKKPRLPNRPNPLVRALDMPKRPPCVAGSAGGDHKVYVFVRPNSKALYLRMDCVDWLVSYAADEHYYQGVRCFDDAPPEKKTPWEIDYDFDKKVYEGTINVGVNAGRTTRMSMHQLTKEMFDKIAVKLDCLGYWSKATPTLKRRACREFVESWCKAGTQGSLQEFIDEWSGICNIIANAKRRKMDVETTAPASQPGASQQEGQTAVAASQQGTPGQQEGQTAVAASQQEIVCAAAVTGEQATTAVPQSQPGTADADAVEYSQRE